MHLRTVGGTARVRINFFHDDTTTPLRGSPLRTVHASLRALKTYPDAAMSEAAMLPLELGRKTLKAVRYKDQVYFEPEITTFPSPYLLQFQTIFLQFALKHHPGSVGTPTGPITASDHCSPAQNSIPTGRSLHAT